MKINYDKAFEFIMRWEGYKSEDPQDPGGRTIFGISARSYPEVVARLWDLPKEEARIFAKEFYRVECWDALGCDGRLWPEDIYLFDTGVNLGIRRAQEILAYSKGPTEFLFRRIDFYVSISAGAKIKFLRGWIRRVVALYEVI